MSCHCQLVACHETITATSDNAAHRVATVHTMQAILQITLLPHAHHTLSISTGACINVEFDCVLDLQPDQFSAAVAVLWQLDSNPSCSLLAHHRV